jgi:hypothetical protein
MALNTRGVSLHAQTANAAFRNCYYKLLNSTLAEAEKEN